MTRDEVIDQLESLLGHCKTMRESGEIWARDCEALRIAIAALRGPTREQVEKAWRGEWERITDPYGQIEGFLCKCGTQTYSASNFCPRCGALMTDEAVDIVMERADHG